MARTSFRKNIQTYYITTRQFCKAFYCKNGRTNRSPAKIFILLESYLLFDISYQLVDLDTLLLHCISVSYCYTAVLNRIKVICDAEWCTDLVLTAISLTDRACLVIVNKEVL